MNHRDHLDANTVRKATELNITRLRTMSAVYNIALRVFEKLDGKEITKRFETALKKELSDNFVTHYENGEYTCKICVWNFKEKMDYNQRMTIYLPYDTYRLFSYSEFKKTSCQYDFEEYILSAQAALANVDELVKEYNAAFDALETVKAKLYHLTV